MYGTSAAGGGGLAATGLASGHIVLFAVGMVFVGLTLFALFFRKSSPVKP